MDGPASAKNLTASCLSRPLPACRNSWHDAKVLAPYWAEAVGDTFIQLAADYAFGREEAEAFEYYLEQEGVTKVKDTIYAPLDTTDFTPYLQEVLDSGADGVIYIWAGATTIPLVQQTRKWASPGLAAQAFFNSNELQLAFADANSSPATGYSSSLNPAGHRDQRWLSSATKKSTTARAGLLPNAGSPTPRRWSPGWKPPKARP